MASTKQGPNITSLRGPVRKTSASPPWIRFLPSLFLPFHAHYPSSFPPSSTHFRRALHRRQRRSVGADPRGRRSSGAETRRWGSSSWSTRSWRGARWCWPSTPSSPATSPPSPPSACRSSPPATTSSHTTATATPSTTSSRTDSVSIFRFLLPSPFAPIRLVPPGSAPPPARFGVSRPTTRRSRGGSLDPLGRVRLGRIE